MALANILRTDAARHRPLPADTELARAIAVLARAHRTRSGDAPTRCNELRSLLREYYPASWPPSPTASAGDLASPEARAVLARRPDPAARRPG